MDRVMREACMSAIRTMYERLFAVSVAAFLAAWPSEVGAQQLRIGPSDIGGVVTGANGPEAGVWVIAETTGLGTRRYAKIVVTDEQGRYLLPALPSGAQYNVWVRGFGLVDSRRVPAKPGMTLNLPATVAPNARAAAQYYPGSYWWSMLKIPEKGLFPGNGPKGNGMPTALKSQADWMDAIKQNGCGNCHQVGSSIMRSIDHAALGVGEKDTQAAWMARLRMGQSGTAMVAGVNSLMTNDGGLLGRLANWTDRIAAGELPKQKPDRPQGVERNIVVTLWEQPEFCQKGADHPSAKAFPRERASGPATNTANFVQNARGVTMYDPKTKQWAFVDTCFGTHHLNFGYDADNTLYLANNGGPELGWVNTRVFLETGDSAKAQGWTPFIVDTNGNGKRDDYVEPDATVDPRKDKRFNLGFYGIAVNPNDGTVRGSTTSGRGWIVRVDLGPNPPVTALTEAYQLPPTELGIRGMDLDSKGIAWAAGVGGNLISFDRSKCRIRNGPTATGDHCPEGFTLHPIPGPKFDGVEGPVGTIP